MKIELNKESANKQNLNWNEAGNEKFSNSSKSQAEIIANKMKQEEDRRPGLEHEVEELGYSIKKGGKILKTYVNGIDRNFETPQKGQIYKLWT